MGAQDTGSTPAHRVSTLAVRRADQTVLEAALDKEMAEQLGYDKHAQEGRNFGNSRNRKRAKTALTDKCGEVDDRGTPGPGWQLEPQLVKKRQRRLSDVHGIVLTSKPKGSLLVRSQPISRGVRRLRLEGHRPSDHRSSR